MTFKINRIDISEAADLISEATRHTIDEGPQRVHTIAHPSRGDMIMIEGSNGDFLAIQQPRA